MGLLDFKTPNIIMCNPSKAIFESKKHLRNFQCMKFVKSKKLSVTGRSLASYDKRVELNHDFPVPQDTDLTLRSC